MNPPTFCNYTLLSELGRGGVSTVYRARDNRTGKLVALKVLNKQKQSDASVRERFRRESKFQFLHPKIVPVLETDVCGDQLYFTMALVEGESLERKIQRGPLTLRQLYPYLRDVADALDTAHQRGIVHRDIKPSNILIRVADDIALLTDFGVAKQASVSVSSLTQSPVHLVGTPDYASPEAARGLRDVTGASDIYSLGVTAYFALAGRLPFVADNPLIVVHKHANEVPPTLRQVNPRIPERVSRVVMQALNKNPRERYASAGAFAHAFTEAVMQSQGHSALPRPNRWVWMGLAAGGVIAAFALVTLLTNTRDDVGAPAKTVVPAVTRSTTASAAVANPTQPATAMPVVAPMTAAMTTAATVAVTEASAATRVPASTVVVGTVPSPAARPGEPTATLAPLPTATHTPRPVPTRVRPANTAVPILPTVAAPASLPTAVPQQPQPAQPQPEQPAPPQPEPQPQPPSQPPPQPTDPPPEAPRPAPTDVPEPPPADTAVPPPPPPTDRPPPEEPPPYVRPPALEP